MAGALTLTMGVRRAFWGDHAGWRFCNNVAYGMAWSEMELLASVAFLTPVGKVVPVFHTREISRGPSRWVPREASSGR